MNAFLTEIARNYAKYETSRIDNLMVDTWDKRRWGEEDISCILLMCRKHEIKRLFFVSNRGKVMWGGMELMGYGHLPLHLTEIVVHHDGDNLPFQLKSLFAKASIRSICCFIMSDDYHTVRSRVRSFLDFMWDESWLQNRAPEGIEHSFVLPKREENYNRTIRSIKYDTPGHTFRPDMLPPNDFIPGREVMRIVEGNWNAWRNCQIITMALLSRRIRRVRQLDINVYKLIAKLVWATRDSPVWIPRTSLATKLLDKFKK